MLAKPRVGEDDPKLIFIGALPRVRLHLNKDDAFAQSTPMTTYGVRGIAQPFNIADAVEGCKPPTLASSSDGPAAESSTYEQSSRDADVSLPVPALQLGFQRR